MARQSFIWTALPNGFTADGTGLRLSVMLSPRLDPQDPAGNPQKLSTFFPDWEDWPATLANARFDISYNGHTVSVPADDDRRVQSRRRPPRPRGFDRLEGAVHRRLCWSSAFAYKDLSRQVLLSYDTVVMAAVDRAAVSRSGAHGRSIGCRW